MYWNKEYEDENGNTLDLTCFIILDLKKSDKSIGMTSSVRRFSLFVQFHSPGSKQGMFRISDYFPNKWSVVE